MSSPARAAAFDALLAGADFPACCADVYASPAVRWLLDGELHPGGAELTRRAIELARIGAADRVLDVAAGGGASALLLAREVGCRVTGLDYGAGAVAEAAEAASVAGLEPIARFVRGDAEALPFEDSSFDVVLCECSLCTFTDKATAVAEMARVLRPGGRVAIADVTADVARLPQLLRGEIARVACVAGALTADGYRDLLKAAGFEVVAGEPHRAELAEMADIVEARLRVARMLGSPELSELGPAIDAAVEMASLAQGAIEDGRLGYAIFVGRLA